MRAVVLDLDGTLFDHPGSARRGLSEWLAGLDVQCSEELVAAWFDAESRHWAAWRQGLVTVAEQRRGRLREFLPLAGIPVGADNDLDGLFAGFQEAYARAWSGYEDVDAALSATHRLGLRTAVLTNGAENQQRAKLAHLGLLERVGPVYTAEALGVAKPHPGAFHAVCARLGLPPRDVLHVGDDYDLDVVAARSAGLRAIHLDRTGSTPAGRPDRITSLGELAATAARTDDTSTLHQ